MLCARQTCVGRQTGLTTGPQLVPPPGPIRIFLAPLLVHSTPSTSLLTPPQLTEKATARAAEEGIDQQDALVKELLHWFKHDFFKWASAEPSTSFSTLPSNRAPAAACPAAVL